MNDENTTPDVEEGRFFKGKLVPTKEIHNRCSTLIGEMLQGDILSNGFRMKLQRIMSYIKTLTARNENQKKLIIELKEKVDEKSRLLREQQEDNKEGWLDLYEIISELVPEWTTHRMDHPRHEALRMALHDLAAKKTTLEDKARAWEAVYDTMRELVPNFISYGNTGMAMAVNVVKSLTKKQDNISKDAIAYHTLSAALRIENPSYATQHGDVSNETAACLEIYSVFRKNRRLTARIETIEKTLAQMNLKVL